MIAENIQQPEIDLNLINDFKIDELGANLSDFGSDIISTTEDAIISSLSTSGIPIPIGEKKLEQLVLPNGIIPNKIPPRKILLLISFKKVRKNKPKVRKGGSESEADTALADDQFAAEIVADTDPDAESDFVDLNDEEIICMDNQLADILLDKDGMLINDKDALIPLENLNLLERCQMFLRDYFHLEE